MDSLMKEADSGDDAEQYKDGSPIPADLLAKLVHSRSVYHFHRRANLLQHLSYDDCPEDKRNDYLILKTL